MTLYHIIIAYQRASSFYFPLIQSSDTSKNLRKQSKKNRNFIALATLALSGSGHCIAQVQLFHFITMDFSLEMQKQHYVLRIHCRLYSIQLEFLTF